MPDLQLGSEGKDVEEVQKALNLYCDNRPQFAELFVEELKKEGLAVAPRLTVSGKFDAATRAAVIAFQTYKRLGTVNGIVDRQTLVALFPCGAWRMTCVVPLEDEAERQRRLFAALMRAAHPDPPAPPDLMRMRDDDWPDDATIVRPGSGLTTISPRISPILPLDILDLPGVGSLPVPRSPFLPNTSHYVSVQAGASHTFGEHWYNPGGTNAYNSVTIDFIGVLFQYLGGEIGMGPDLGWTQPATFEDRKKGAVPSVALWWSFTYAPHWLRWGRLDLLSIGAKFGVRADGTKLGSPPPASGSPEFVGGSLSLQTRFDLVRGDVSYDHGRDGQLREKRQPAKLSVFAKVGPSFGWELTLGDASDGGSALFKSGLSGVIGVSGNF